jgi:hypothetical protein
MMKNNRYASIEDAYHAGKLKGSLWAVSFGAHERYLGHIFQVSIGKFMIVTQRGNLIFSPDEVKSIEWIDDVNMIWLERSYWPAEPYI